jgi:hypothetical protein
MRLLYLAWKHAGACPYRLFNRLDADYRPLEGGPPLRPPRPHRLAAVVYGFAQLAEEESIALATARVGV